jgi:hypothetical protein
MTPGNVDIALEALTKAVETIRALHGKVGWEIYNEHSPEMKQIYIAIGTLAKSQSGAIAPVEKRFSDAEKLTALCSLNNETGFRKLADTCYVLMKWDDERVRAALEEVTAKRTEPFTPAGR